MICDKVKRGKLRRTGGCTPATSAKMTGGGTRERARCRRQHDGGRPTRQTLRGRRAFCLRSGLWRISACPRRRRAGSADISSSSLSDGAQAAALIPPRSSPSSCTEEKHACKRRHGASSRSSPYSSRPPPRLHGVHAACRPLHRPPSVYRLHRRSGRRHRRLRLMAAESSRGGRRHGGCSRVLRHGGKRDRAVRG